MEISRSKLRDLGHSQHNQTNRRETVVGSAGRMHFRLAETSLIYITAMVITLLVIVNTYDIAFRAIVNVAGVVNVLNVKCLFVLR